MSLPLLEARAICLQRDARVLFARLDVSVRSGELLTIGGTSGGGKTTLLRILATLLSPDSGTVLFRGEDTARLPPHQVRARVAYVAQSAPVLPGTVLDNAGVGPRLRGVPCTDRELHALLARVALEPRLAQRPARELSGGERQRLALARALANRPDVLLLDEPTASLDPVSASAIMALVGALATEGLGIVMVSHAGGANVALCDGRLVPQP